MNQIIPFKFESHDIQVIVDDDGEFHFIAKEVSEILGYSDAFEMTKRLDDDEKQNRQIAGFGPRGITVISESGLYSAILGSNKPEAKPFKRWVTHDVIPSIRKTGGYSQSLQGGANHAHPSLVQPAKEFRAMFGIARLIGCDKNAAAISANNAVYKLTGTNVMGLLGHTHLESQDQKMYFTPTELGLKIGGISGRKMNMLLAEAGLQVKQNDKWEPLLPAKGMYRILDTGKAHSDGSMVQQIKWSDDVAALIQQAKAA